MFGLPRPSDASVSQVALAAGKRLFSGPDVCADSKKDSTESPLPNQVKIVDGYGSDVDDSTDDEDAGVEEDEDEVESDDEIEEEEEVSSGGESDREMATIQSSSEALNAQRQHPFPTSFNTWRGYSPTRLLLLTLVILLISFTNIHPLFPNKQLAKSKQVKTALLNILVSGLSSLLKKPSGSIHVLAQQRLLYALCSKDEKV